eukprot:SAG22_NODE_3871_length_1488_cov_1.284377_2_plen_106_part_01
MVCLLFVQAPEVWGEVVARYTRLFDCTAPKELLMPGTVDADTQAAAAVASLRRQEAAAAKAEFEQCREEQRALSMGTEHVVDDVEDREVAGVAAPAGAAAAAAAAA